MSKMIIEAVLAQAKADEAKAVANLNNYMNKSVGVGEHPDIVTECYKLLKEIAEARDLQSIITQVIEANNEETPQKS